jgi:NADH-quinone oxidoreductase subunit E
MAFTLTLELEKLVDDLLSRYPTKQAGCIPLLHLCQRQVGWISPEVIDFVAKRLEMSTSEVKGVVTFYTMFHQKQVAPNVIWVCRTLACEIRGGRLLQKHLEKRLGCKVGGTSKDGQFTLLAAECLAACGQGPAIQINDQYYENLTIEKLDKILDEYAVEKPNAATVTK